MDTHLRHEQGEEEDLVFWDIMILQAREKQLGVGVPGARHGPCLHGAAL